MRPFLVAFRLIPVGWRGRFWVVTGLSTVVALLETLGVASVMPFVALLSDPSVVERSLAQSPLGRLLPHGVGGVPVHIVGAIVIALFVITNLLNLATLWVSVRFSARLGGVLCHQLSEGYLRRGYLYLRTVGAAVAANDVTRETEKLVGSCILQLCLVISKAIQVLLVVGLLALVSPAFTLTFFGLSVVLYSGLYKVLRKRTAAAGQQAMDATAESSLCANEVFSAAKDILVRKREQYFVSRIAATCNRFYSADAVARVVPAIPKYMIEMTAFSALLAVPVYRSMNGEEYRSLLPVIALFAYAGYRILPALQQAYSSFTILKFFESLAVRIGLLLESSRGEASRTVSGSELKEFRSEISFENVSYVYPGASSGVLAAFSTSIKRGQKIAVVGPSGAGKSTFLDVLLGLIAINDGALRVDGYEAGERFNWGVPIGYVPQAPTIISGTVAENIAFGMNVGEISLERCLEVAKLAGLDSVIDGLPLRYKTVLGGGVGLSGGEAQRLAIARALYHSPALLVMDEPSSALDPGISEQVMKRLCSGDCSATLVVVTHDWDLLPLFDRVIVIDAGVVAADGTPGDLRVQLESLREQCASVK